MQEDRNGQFLFLLSAKYSIRNPRVTSERSVNCRPPKNRPIVTDKIKSRGLYWIACWSRCYSAYANEPRFESKLDKPISPGENSVISAKAAKIPVKRISFRSGRIYRLKEGLCCSCTVNNSIKDSISGLNR